MLLFFAIELQQLKLNVLAKGVMHSDMKTDSLDDIQSVGCSYLNLDLLIILCM